MPEKQEVTALMAIDLSAAFDTVDHDIMLTVLNNCFGINGTALKWCESYLRPRFCKVNVGSEYSENKKLDFSVPQGSCMGPVLYLAYASTMKTVISADNVLHGYADDHALKQSFRACDRNAETTTIKRLESNACMIKEWMDTNRLKMNSSETELILFGSKTQLKKCHSQVIRR